MYSNTHLNSRETAPLTLFLINEIRYLTFFVHRGVILHSSDRFHFALDLYVEGTVTPKTKVWAQGMEGWRLLQQVPQLKWTLVAKGTPVLNESELAILILRILIQMTTYYPSRDGDGAIIRNVAHAHS